MNKNRKRIKRLEAKENKGKWPKPVFKKKVKPFPKVEEGPTLREQREQFYGPQFIA
jgi:hypothetical protein